MALIEGVGDEVTLLLAALLGLAVLLLAWVSTRTPDQNPEQTPERNPEGETERTVEQTAGPSASAASDLSTEAPPPTVGGAEKPEGEEGEEGLRQRGGGRRREEQNSFIIRLKFLNDTERTANVRPEDTVGDIKRSVFPGQEARVRLIFQGQLLRDDSASVASLGLSNLSVLHCHISALQGPGQQPGEGPQSQGGPAVLNLGALMVPLLLLMLLLLWFCQLQYKHLFTAPATASLAGLTVVLSVVAYGVYRR